MCFVQVNVFFTGYFIYQIEEKNAMKKEKLLVETKKTGRQQQNDICFF